mmetsp:Transcript_39537/g.105095  ORF Transcript_39537/g.105095 Transcript_39537/m.105095 type:complete len:154 (+) Transcript_39537:572-1033(+)
MWSSSAGVRTTRYGCQNRILSQCMVFYIEFFALSSLLSNILAQTSADGDMSLFKVGGAMTNAFVRAMAEGPFPTYPELLHRLHRQLRSRGFTQRPQLTSSQAFNVRERVFSLTEGFEPNRNPQIGRMQRRKFRTGGSWASSAQVRMFANTVTS